MSVDCLLLDMAVTKRVYFDELNDLKSYKVRLHWLEINSPVYYAGMYMSFGLVIDID